MKITVVAGVGANPALVSEFGLALLLENEGKSFLFDTGAGESLLHNLKALEIPLEKCGSVILSHGHYDHTGGLAFLNPEELWFCSGVEDPQYSRHADGTMHKISMPAASLEVARKVAQATPMNLFDYIGYGIFLTGPIARRSPEDCGGDFFHDEACTQKDIVPEEQALLSTSGVLVTGCCHAGIINTLFHCHKMLPELPIHTIVGGLHLKNADVIRLEQTANILKQFKVKNLYLMHCTVENAIAYLKEHLPQCNIFTPELGETFTV
jgi:7,8-dihydropterin-6-yl-methyl-4-(beta-D-ribofuranosyl)aminobenzene 5'-phosphate synthase